MSKINVLKTIKKYRIADKSPANDEIVNKEVNIILLYKNYIEY